MRAELVPIDGGLPIQILKDITVIGRRAYCDIQIDDPSLSKRHCVVIKTDGLLMIRDLASTNGTRVKGQLIRWAALLPNDRIEIGKIKFRGFLGPAEPSSRPLTADHGRDNLAATLPSSSSGPKQSTREATTFQATRIDQGRNRSNDDARWSGRVDHDHPDDDEIIDLE